jgi:hypothetical protein
MVANSQKTFSKMRKLWGRQYDRTVDLNTRYGKHEQLHRVSCIKTLLTYIARCVTL